MALNYGISEDLAWEMYEQDTEQGWGLQPEGEGVERQQPQTEKVGLDGSGYKAVLPSRPRQEIPEAPTDPQVEQAPEMTGFFGIGNPFEKPMEAVEQVVDAGVGVVRGFFNAVSSPFELYDEGSEDLSEAKDPDTEVLRNKKPYVVLKDEKTGTRVKMAAEPAKAYSGLKQDLVNRGKGDKVTLQESAESGNGVLRHAQNWVGKEYNPGAREQCAHFVRSVFDQMGIKVGASQNPVDKVQTGDLQGPGYANSFFGEDVGTLVKDQDDLMPGDIVGFTNTYGDFAPGTITHVGIYAGNGKVIDRPTANAPVQERDATSLGGIAIGVRPYGLGKAGSHAAAHQIAIDPTDPEALETAQKYGFTPTGQRGVMSYMGAFAAEEAYFKDREPTNIPYESDEDWTPDMERAYSAAWDVGVDENVFLNLVKQESNWNPNAVNKKSGAFGLTQLMPATAMEQARAMGLDVSLQDIKKNPELQATIGAGYYKRMLDKFGNHPQALAAYNAGPGAVDAMTRGALEPYEETVDYVSKILRVPKDQAKSMIVDFRGMKDFAVKELELGEVPPATEPVIPPKEQMEAEAEVGAGFFTPRTPKEKVEMLKGLEKSEDPLPAEMQNYGAQRKKRSREELARALASIPEPEGGSNSIDGGLDNWDLAKSVASSTLGMLVEGLDQIGNLTGTRTLVDAAVGKVLGEDFDSSLGNGVLSAFESVLGADPSRGEDFKFGQIRTRKWLKGFGNTLSFGLANYLSPNGTIYTKEELENTELQKIAARQQGGFIMSEGPVDPKSWHAAYLDMMTDVGDNPLAMLAVPLQMQAMAAMGTSAALTRAAATPGVRGTLSKGAQHFLNYMGGQKAMGSGVGWAAGALTNSAIRFEVSTGILAGTEVFNNAFAQNLHRIDEGADYTLGEAFADASQSAVIATGLGLILGLAGTGGGLLTQQTAKGLKSAAGDLAGKPLVEGTRFGQGITDAVQWAGERIRRIDESERFKHIRALRQDIATGVKEMYDKSVGRIVEDFRSARLRAEIKSEYNREASHLEFVARESESRAQHGVEIVRSADAAVKAKDAEIKHLDDSIGQVIGLEDDPLSAYRTAKQRRADIDGEIQQASAERNAAMQARQAGAKDDTGKEAFQKLIKLQKEKGDLDILIPQLRGKIQMVADKNGIVFTDPQGAPKKFDDMEKLLLEANQAKSEMPEVELVKEAPAILEMAKNYQKAAQIAREKSALYKEVSKGTIPISTLVPESPWRPLDEPVTTDNISNHLASVYDRPGEVLPSQRMAEINQVIMAQAPMQKSINSMDRFISALERVEANGSDAVKGVFGKEIKEWKEALTRAQKEGKNAWAVMESLRQGGGDEILDTLLLQEIATRTPTDVEVPLYKLSQESQSTRMALLAKLSELNYGDARSQAQKILDDINKTVAWEEKSQPVRNIIRGIVDLRFKEYIGDLPREAGGTEFFEDSMVRNKGKFERAKEGWTEARERGDGFASSVTQAVGEAFSSMGKTAADPLNIVRASGAEMVSSKVAYDNLGTYIRLAVDDTGGVFTTAVKNLAEMEIPIDKFEKSLLLQEFKAAVDAAGDDYGVRQEAAEQFFADILFEGGERLKQAVKDVPEVVEIIRPVMQLHSALDNLKLLTPDAKEMADHFYIKNFFPGMKRYDELWSVDGKMPTYNSRNVLMDGGVIDKDGGYLMSMKDIDELVKESYNKLGDQDPEKFIQMSQNDRMKLLGEKSGRVDPNSGETIPFSDKETKRVLAGVLMKNRLKKPGEVLEARVASIGNSETQRKFLERLSKASDENGSPLVRTLGPDDKIEDIQQEGYISLTKIDRIIPKSYEINGQVYKPNKIFMKKEALELYSSLIGDWDFAKKGSVERAMRTVNMLALQGGHSPFLATIGANVWKMMGFNMAKTHKVFNIREGIGPTEWSKITIRAAQVGLADQSVARNATMLSKAFLAENRSLLSDAQKSLMQQPGWAEAQAHLMRAMTGMGPEGVVKRFGQAGKNLIDGTIAFDEFMMEHLLFQNLRDAQYGVWMYKANELETKLAPKMLKEGFAPEAIRETAEREAAAFVNEFTGSVRTGVTSKKARGIFGIFGMTPQFTMARLRAIQGMFSENTFRHLPASSRKRLVAEYQSMGIKMGLAALGSTALFQYALSGRSIADNPQDKQMKIWAGGDYYFSNPLATMFNTMSKMTGMQELGRMSTLLMKDAVGMEVPQNRLNSMDRDTISGSIYGGLEGMAGQVAKQAVNLTNPLLRSGIDAFGGDGVSSVNPEASLPLRAHQVMAKNWGLYQFATNSDPWTGDALPGWQRGTSLMGIYASKDMDIKNYDIKVSKMKREAKDLIHREIGNKLKAAYEYEAAGNTKKAHELMQEAYMAADPYAEFKDKGGVAVNKEVRRLLRNDKGFFAQDGRIRMTEEEWHIAIKRARNPKGYQIEKATLNTRGDSTAEALRNNEGVQDVRENSTGAVGGFGEAVRRI